ncbi:C2 calcium-dependent membrane targeting [Macleaya cordata]|uniref:C2 calcium-dependent membrane targeting n=1 Tax=Macleaya cordata TaxID=56857 RepID=A0A200QUH2_MACCD|nr:C2 calcium-dependent membrane targeting [Macleaya cordata]
MPQGKLEIVLISVIGLESTDFLGKMDSYAILTCGSQEQKSTVSKDTIVDAASRMAPTWNETFVFNITEGTSELTVKLMDKDRITSDDFLGQAIIPLSPFLFREDKSLTPTYNVIKDDKYCGILMVTIKFFPDEECSAREESCGGCDN